jgi:hypothetical protein
VAKRRIENTEAKVNADPMGMFTQMVLGGTEQAILRQEADGQRQLVASEQIPSRLFDCTTDDLVRLGFTFPPDDGADPLFVAATLPPGWRYDPTDHAMWSRILDAKGRERFAVFYKASYHDRGAHMRPNCRFRLEDHHPVPTEGQFIVWDGPDLIFRGTTYSEASGEEYDRARSEAKAWLVDRYPDYEDPFAYWDQE